MTTRNKIHHNAEFVTVDYEIMYPDNVRARDRGQQVTLPNKPLYRFRPTSEILPEDLHRHLAAISTQPPPINPAHPTTPDQLTEQHLSPESASGPRRTCRLQSEPIHHQSETATDQ